ncbi:hypothetical protein OC834_007155 [Tilletia horrida]|nr:hypothetical protein OC834_007155 [Tilletia horrida]
MTIDFLLNYPGEKENEHAAVRTGEEIVQDVLSIIQDVEETPQNLVKHKEALQAFRTIEAYAKQQSAQLDLPQSTKVRQAVSMLRFTAHQQVSNFTLHAQAIAAIRKTPGRFTLQHDAWTTPSGREAFLAVYATWIDDAFQHRFTCPTFERLGMDHNGATFAGHLAGMLDAHKIWTSGRASSSRSSDAAEVNVRAIRFLAWEVQDEKRSLPDEVREYLLPFTIADNVVLCLAHGLNRTVVDGLAAAGAHVTMAASFPPTWSRFLLESTFNAQMDELFEEPEAAGSSGATEDDPPIEDLNAGDEAIGGKVGAALRDDSAEDASTEGDEPDSAVMWLAAAQMPGQDPRFAQGDQAFHGASRTGVSGGQRPTYATHAAQKHTLELAPTRSSRMLQSVTA